jgi:hypothetical protein
VFISFLLAIKVYSQETSNIGHLELMPGKTETYYVEGHKDKAEYLQILIEDAVLFHENLLKDTFSFELWALD